MTQRLFALSPDTIFAARVNQPAGVTYPLSSVEFDTVTTGAAGDVKVGMTALFGSTAGADDLGRKRIRAAADSDTIFLGRGSRGIRDGEVNISDNDHITVIDTRSVWSKIPNIDANGNVVKDEIVYTDQNENIYPKANIEGGWRAATINSGTSLATFQFIGTASYAQGGATISTYLWNVGSGTITVGTSASNTVTATFAAGYHWVSLTVTDSNGKTHKMEVLVYADDPDDSDCVAFECVEHQITQQGQTTAFRILEDVPESTHPDGMPVIFWEGEPSSASDYSNVLFWGWHQTDDNSVTAEKTGTLKDTALNCLDLAGRLDALPGFPQSLTRDATPASWLEMAGLDLPLHLDYLLRWHSSAFELGYYTSAAGSGYDIPIIGSDGESLFNQAAKMAAAMIPDHILTCDRHGALRVLHDPVLQNTADRTATSQASITSSNILAISWQRQRPPRIHWNWPYAIAASASEVDYFSSRAPGEAPGQGLSSNEVNYKLAKSQQDLNDCAGHRYAYLNSFTGQIAVTMAADLDIDPADMTWVTLDLASSYHRRQIGFTAARCLPVEVNISYDYQPTGTVKTVELLLEEETSGTPGVTYEEEDTDYEWTPPVVIVPPTPTPTPQGDGFGTVYVLTNSVLGRTRDFSAASPAWVDISPSGTYTATDFILDPWNPTTTAYHLSSDGVHKSTTMLNSSPTWTNMLTEASILSTTGATVSVDIARISCSINVQDYVGVLVFAYNGGGGANEHWYFYSTNGGTSWNSVNIMAAATAISIFDIVPHLIGGQLMLYGFFHTNNDMELWKSTDSGASWTKKQTISTATQERPNLVHCPYNNNPNGDIVYFGYNSPGASTGETLRSTNGGDSYTLIAGGNSDIGGVNSGTEIRRMGLETYTQNRQRVFLWEEADSQLYVSTDAGDTWTAAAQSGLSNVPMAAGGFPHNGQQYYVVVGNGIYVSIDGGASFVNKTGDWSFGFTTVTDEFFYDVIVPVWVAE